MMSTIIEQPFTLKLDDIKPKTDSLISTTTCLPTPPQELDLDSSILPDLDSATISLESTPTVAVIGVGYVGTHLMEVFSSQYNTVGFDISPKRVSEVRQQFDGNPRVTLTTEVSQLADATHYLISVPTLLLPDKSIDSSYLRSAIETVSKHARPGSTIIIESSVAVGMTREFLGPVAAQKRCFAGMSPERVDPGRVQPAAAQIPKVISGLDDVCPGSLESILRLYSKVFDRVIPVSSPEVAEMTKLYENCQRMMCIAYANEMANACRSHNIDPYEVCDAAATKPFGYMPYTPGVGVGGHCIPVNPYYLLANNSFPLLQAATETMWQRPAALADECFSKLCSTDNAAPLDTAAEADRSRILVVGVGFKPGQSTLSNSPGLAILKRLNASGKADVTFADSLVSQNMVPDVPRLPDDQWNARALGSFDMVVVAMRQVGLDFDILQDLPASTKVEFLCK